MCKKSFPLLAGLFVLVCCSVIYATNWPKFHFNNANTGASPDNGPGSNNIKWTFKNSNRGLIKSPLAVVDGKVYCGDKTGWLYCFNAGSGEVVWEKKYPYSFGTSGPCVVGDKIYIGTEAAGIVYCFNTSDGTQAWSYDTDLSDQITSPVVYSNKVYVGVNKYIYCLNDANGALVWKFYTDSGDYIRNAPAIYSGRLYVSSDNTEVWCISPADANGNGWIDHDNSNELYWSYASHGGNSSPVVVNYNSNNYLFVARNSGASGVAGVVCIDIDTHTEHSYYSAGGGVWGTPVFSQGWLYFGSDDKKFYAYVFNTSNPDWSYETTGTIQCSPALSVGDHRIYFPSGNNNLYCFKSQTTPAEMVWSDTSHCYTHQCPTVANDVLYVAGSWNDLNAYGASSGNATVNSYCYSDGQSVSVPIAMNGVPTGFNTPYTFTGVDSNTTFSVPSIDANGHPFLNWSNCQSTLTVTLGGYDALTVYYGLIDYNSVNLDGVSPVNFEDFAILADVWLLRGPAQPSDLDGDGIVGLLDLKYFVYYWLQ